MIFFFFFFCYLPKLDFFFNATYSGGSRGDGDYRRVTSRIVTVDVYSGMCELKLKR